MKWMPIMWTGLAVRMDLLDERQAQINHGQSLDWLCRRYFESIRRNRAQTWSAVLNGVIGRHESVRFLHSEGL